MNFADDLFVSRHCLERLHMMHPRAGVGGALRMIKQGTELSLGAVTTLMLRHPRSKEAATKYILAPDHSGVFIIIPSTRDNKHDGDLWLKFVAVTFKRLNDDQYDLCAKLMGPPATAIRWATSTPGSEHFSASPNEDKNGPL